MAGTSKRKRHTKSSSSESSFEHQIFLNFRGEDVRKTFVDHLFVALKGSGFKVFRDNDGLEHGEEIQSNLYQAIERSQLSIVTLSSRYADSRWCLDELVKIMRCRFTLGHTVLPVFYDVEPTHVRKQSGPYKEAFEAHEVQFRGEIDRVNNWRLALKEVADLKGLTSTDFDGYEAQFIENIVKAVRKKVARLLYLPPFIVGIDHIVKEISDWLQDGSESVEFGMIYGLSGIGKTTIAKIAYNGNLDEFDCCSFIVGFNELTKQWNGFSLLLEQLMADICGKTPEKVYNYDKGLMEVRAILSKRRILLILDNVDLSTQIRPLLQIMSSLHPGSKVIITTVNKALRNYASLKREFKVNPLSHDKATLIFCHHAFGKDVPSKIFKSIVDSFVEYCGGLPLALEVLAFSLGKQRLEMWECQLAKLESYPKKELLNVLKLTFDSLEDDNDKDIFLHVAFFMVGMQKDLAIHILKSCNLHPVIGLENLNNMCLVTVDLNDRLTMHHLVREMGKHVVQLEDPVKPGNRSRLWCCSKEAFLELRANEGTMTIKGMRLEFPMPLTRQSSIEDEYNHLSSKRSSWRVFGKSTPPSITRNSKSVRTDAFTNMKKLNILQMNNILLEGGFTEFPEAIKWLRWNGCTLESLPFEFDLDELVVLEMCNSKLVHCWEAGKFLGALRVLNLSHSHNLVDTPDFSLASKIEWMSFEDCVSLVKIHESIGGLTKLTYLNLSGCINLKRLPDGIYKLDTLEVLNLSGSPCVFKVPNFFGRLSRTTSPYFSFNVFRSLGVLTLKNCGIQDDILYYLRGCSSLRDLDLGGNPITAISENLGYLTELRYLKLDGCEKLQSISTRPQSLVISCRGCTSLESIANTSGQQDSVLSLLYSNDCPKQTDFEGSYKFEVTWDMDAERAKYMGYSGMESLDAGDPSLRGVYSLREGIYNALVMGDHIARWFTKVETIEDDFARWFTKLETEEDILVNSFSYTVPLLPNRAIRAFNVGCVLVNYGESVRGIVRLSNRTGRWSYNFNLLSYDVGHLGQCEMTGLTHWCVVKGRELRPGDQLEVGFKGFKNLRKYGIQIIYKEKVVEVEAKDVNSDNTMEVGVESHGCSSSGSSCSGEIVIPRPNRNFSICLPGTSKIPNPVSFFPAACPHMTEREREREMDRRETNNNVSAATTDWYTNTFLAVDLSPLAKARPMSRVSDDGGLFGQLFSKSSDDVTQKKKRYDDGWIEYDNEAHFVVL